MNDNTVVLVLVTLASLVAGAAGYFVRATDVDPWKIKPTWAHIKDADGKVTRKVAAMGLGANVFVSLTAGFAAYLAADVVANALLVGHITGADGKVTVASSLALYSVQALAVLLGAFGGANFIQKLYDKRIDTVIDKVAEKDANATFTAISPKHAAIPALTAEVEMDLRADERPVFYLVETKAVEPEVTYQ